MHVPVVTDKVLQYLDLKPNQNVIDCTAGEGGHTFAIAENIQPHGMILALEWDREAAKLLAEQVRQRKWQHRIRVVSENFAHLKEVARQEKFRPVHRILFDLGFSSGQLEQSRRGFSFHPPAGGEPLDMRYSEENPQTAEKIVNYQSRGELERLLKEYGEEQFAKQIAAAIVEARSEKPIRSTAQLVSIIEEATPASYRKRKIHPATKTFQALRIATNNELDNIEQGLKQAGELLEPGGRVAVISFHSLEDRIVKKIFKTTPLLKPLMKKPVTPSLQEMKKNPRARSAKLRVAQKLSFHAHTQKSNI